MTRVSNLSRRHHATSDTVRRIRRLKRGMVRRFAFRWPKYRWTLKDDRDFQRGLIVDVRRVPK